MVKNLTYLQGMVVEVLIILSPIVAEVAKSILVHHIQEEIWVKRICHKIFPPKRYETELIKEINESIKNYALLHPYDGKNEKFPFYYSQIIFEELSKQILFGKRNNVRIEKILHELKVNPHIICPSQQELIDFFSFFNERIHSNTILKKIFIEENYKEEIFEISEGIRSINKKADEMLAVLKKRGINTASCF